MATNARRGYMRMLGEPDRGRQHISHETEPDEDAPGDCRDVSACPRMGVHHKWRLRHGSFCPQNKKGGSHRVEPSGFEPVTLLKAIEPAR